MNKTSVTVFTTASGRHCPNCGLPVSDCACARSDGAAAAQWKDGIVRVRREKQGRGGKTVTVVRNIPGAPDEIKRHAAALKKRLGTGGSEKNRAVEIQGDHVDSVIEYFKNLNMKIKKDGG